MKVKTLEILGREILLTLDYNNQSTYKMLIDKDFEIKEGESIKVAPKKGNAYVFGLGSYSALFKDQRFTTALGNTAVYAVIVPLISVVLSLLLANALVNIKNEKIRGFFQSVYFLPYVTSMVAIGGVWSWLFHSEYGVINYILSFLV